MKSHDEVKRPQTFEEVSDLIKGIDENTRSQVFYAIENYFEAHKENINKPIDENGKTLLFKLALLANDILTTQGPGKKVNEMAYLDLFQQAVALGANPFLQIQDNNAIEILDAGSVDNSNLYDLIKLIEVNLRERKDAGETFDQFNALEKELLAKRIQTHQQPHQPKPPSTVSPRAGLKEKEKTEKVINPELASEAKETLKQENLIAAKELSPSNPLISLDAYLNDAIVKNRNILQYGKFYSTQLGEEGKIRAIKTEVQSFLEHPEQASKILKIFDRAQKNRDGHNLFKDVQDLFRSKDKTNDALVKQKLGIVTVVADIASENVELFPGNKEKEENAKRIIAQANYSMAQRYGNVVNEVSGSKNAQQQNEFNRKYASYMTSAAEFGHPEAMYLLATRIVRQNPKSEQAGKYFENILKLESNKENIEAIKKTVKYLRDHKDVVSNLSLQEQLDTKKSLLSAEKKPGFFSNAQQKIENSVKEIFSSPKPRR